MDKKLSDNEVHDELFRAKDLLSSKKAETIRGQTALDAASRAIQLLGCGLVKAQEESSDEIEGVK